MAHCLFSDIIILAGLFLFLYYKPTRAGVYAIFVSLTVSCGEPMCNEHLVSIYLMNEMLSLKKQNFDKLRDTKHKLLAYFPGCLLIQLAD